MSLSMTFRNHFMTYYKGHGTCGEEVRRAIKGESMPPKPHLSVLPQAQLGLSQ
jgi:hypothetical protein